MAELIANLQELTSLPADFHWFCPREKQDEEQELFFDEDINSTESETPEYRSARNARIQRARDRRDLFVKSIQILAFDGEDAKPYQKSLQDHLLVQLTRCTICVREYHKGRADLQQELHNQYEADQVQQFMERFDSMNAERIARGLTIGKDDMLELPIESRKINKLSPAGLYALFETMHSMQFLTDEDALQLHFDEVLRLVQTNKKITIPDYTPATTLFLFSDNEIRHDFAVRCWARLGQTIKGSEFDWAVKDQLGVAVNRVLLTSLDKDFLPAFWSGVATIVRKLDHNVIAHHLRAMDVDICKLALEHLQIESSCFTDLLDAFQTLLELGSSAVWDALGAISPPTVVEQIFNSPNLEILVRDNNSNDNPARLEACLGWIDPFIRSLRPSYLPNTCKTLLHQTLHRYQAASFSGRTRRVFQLYGLKVLSISFSKIQSADVSAGPAIAGLLDILRPHMPNLIGNVHKGNGDAMSMESLSVVHQAIAADVLLLAGDRDHAKNRRALALESDEASTELWRASIKGVGSRDYDLAAAVFQGCFKLLVLDPVPTKDTQSSKDCLAWNQRLSEKHDMLADLFDRMQDFDQKSLDVMLKDATSCEGLLSLLFAGDKTTQESAASMIKVLTAENNRSDAIKDLLHRSFVPALDGLSAVLRTISLSQVFGPAQMTIKAGKDFLYALCDSSDGILRSRELSSSDVVAVERLWQSLWSEIKTIFDSTEQWSQMGHEKDLMKDFCRNAMDFANQVFDLYSVISGSIHSSAILKDSRLQTDKRLLESPANAAASIVTWFRLRDEYLITKAIDLARKIMGRLREVEVELPSVALDFIEGILTDRIKNKVPSNLRAQLRHALDIHVDEVIQSEQKVKKQSDLSGWMSSGSSTPVDFPAVIDKPKAGSIDVAAWKDAARRRADVKGKDEKELQKIISASTFDKHKESGMFKSGRPPPAQTGLQFSKQSDETISEFRLKRQAALEEKKKRDALAIAKARRAREGLGEAGSGLAGIGVDGKEHSAIKGEGVMVSSDESNDDDEGGLDADLFGPASKTKRKTTVRQETARVVGLKPDVKPTKIVRQVRTKKDMRARLAPDLGPLHKTMLGWEFFHDGEYPPGSEDWQFKKVSNTFRHVQEYRDTFQPLLTLEAWQGMVRSREEDSNKPFDIKIASRSSVDAFVELSTAISHAEMRDNQLSEGDIILLSTSNQPLTDHQAPHCLSRIDKIKRKGKQVEVIYKTLPFNTKMNSVLKPGAEIRAAKVQSIIPLEREYGSISGLQYYDLCDEIVKARPSPLLQYSDKQLDPLISNYNVNKAQAKAIRSAMDNDAFTLIQGPPGSGKTKTIVAIVGALLTDTLSVNQNGTRITMPRMNGQSSGEPMSKKLLVCAPSNAAVDELVMRFKEGIKTVRGSEKKINVLRLGRTEAVNSAVQDVTLDDLVSKKISATNGDGTGRERERTQLIMAEHKKVSEALREARDRMDSPTVKGEDKPRIQDEINQLRRRKNELGTKIDNAKDAEGAAGRNAELEKRRVQQQIIDESHIICATLSGSGHELFQSLNVEFETVVVDEAAQCVEMSALIPLKYGCAKCILVGDPKQLPPTVFSKEAARFQYEQSLFVRMQVNHPDAVHLLDTQYRMHPEISSFPSASFYDGRLRDGPDMEGLRQRTWHQSALLAPYRFFDVQGQHESAPKGHSLVNKAEIQVAMAIYNRLTSDHRDYDFVNKIGIITPYKSQLRLLKETFANRYGQDILSDIEFNTTDAFQGRESEIIIFSCVRASPAGSIGFLQDIRRMNVGLTRAKCSLWVLGNSQSLMRGEWWGKLVKDAQARDVYTTGDVMGMLKRPSSSFPAKKPPPKSASNAQKTLPPVAKDDSKSSDRAKAIVKPTDLPIFKANTHAGPRRDSGSKAPAIKAEMIHEKTRKPSGGNAAPKDKITEPVPGMKRERKDSSASSASSDKMDIDVKEERDSGEPPAKRALLKHSRLGSSAPGSRTTTPGSSGSGTDTASGARQDSNGTASMTGAPEATRPPVQMQGKAPQAPPPPVRKKAASVFLPKKK